MSFICDCVPQPVSAAITISVASGLMRLETLPFSARMALTSTMYNVTVDLSDVDRGVYEVLDLRMAMHPSESPEYLATRLLAYCLEYTEGIEFTTGLSKCDEPVIVV